MGVIIVWVMEVYECGFFIKEDIDGIEFIFGNGEVVVEVFRKMVYCEGNFGKFFVDGVKRVSERFGKESWKFVMYVKGMELLVYDVCGIKGMVFVFVVSVCGVDYFIVGVYGIEFVGRWWKFDGVDRMKGENKGFEIVFYENFMVIYDVIGMCKFLRYMYFFEGFFEFIEVVIGMNIGEVELMVIGERIMNIVRVFNVREGFSRKDDMFLYRIMWELILEGVSKGLYVLLWEFDRMFDEYY